MADKSGLLVQSRLEKLLADGWLWAGWEGSPVLWNQAERLDGSLLADVLSIVGSEDLEEPDQRLGVWVVVLAKLRGCCLDLLGIS